jgi:uncharacterized membrane protein
VPDIATLHPQIVHFVIALLIIGVLARVVSLIPMGRRFAFTGAMAATLIFLGTAASIVAVKSGLEAHEKVESIPGARAAVNVHEKYGKDTRNIFLVVSVLEIGILAFAARTPGIARGLRVASALVGLGGLVLLFEAGDHGGDLVFEYAGGVGVRSGDTTDVRRLLVAGLYNNAQLDRQAGRPDAAADRFDQLRQMLPADTSVRMLYIQSLVRDRKDPQRALAALDSIEVSASNERLYYQKVTLEAEALDLAGQRDSARALLVALKKDVPRRSGRIDAMLKRMQ